MSNVRQPTSDLRETVEAISMDNTMAQEALAEKNYRAVKAILERQEREIKMLIESAGSGLSIHQLSGDSEVLERET